MRRASGIICAWLYQVALAVWLGGIVVLGAVAAPAIFGAAKDAGQHDWGQPLYRFAGVALGEAFSRFNSLGVASGVLALIAGLAAAKLLDWRGMPVPISGALTLLALAVMVYLTYSLYPTMMAHREAGEMARFDAGHQRYVQAFNVVMVLLLVVEGLALWMANQARDKGYSARSVP